MAYQSVTDSVIASNLSEVYPAATQITGGSMLPVDPWTTGIMAGSQVLGSMASQPKSLSATSRSDSTLAFDNSGWNVSIGGGAITSDRTQQQPIASNWMVMTGLIVVGLVSLKIILNKGKL